MYNFLIASKEFILHCKYEKNLSPKTIKAYEIDLKQAASAFQMPDQHIMVASITKEHIRAYIESISHLKPKSIKRKIATLKALFNFLEFEDKITISPFRKMRIRIKEAKQLPKVMDLQEVQAIFKSVYRPVEKNPLSELSRESLRNIVVIELLFATGARVAEISNLKLQSIDLLSGLTTLHGKGNKERVIHVCNKEALKAMRLYSNTFKEAIERSGGYFFVNNRGNRLSEQSIRNMVSVLAQKAGLKKHITPHVFRHTFGTLLLEKNVDIKYIQSLLGHSSIMTTQIYTHVSKTKEREILKTRHPRKEFSMAAINAG